MVKWKEVYVGGQHLGYATKAEVTPEIKGGEETSTFDGPLIDTVDSISWTVNIDKVRYDTNIKHYKEIEMLLLSCFTNKKTVKIIETGEMPDGRMAVTTQVYNCILTDKKYTIEPEARTVENLSFKGTAIDTWINDEKLPRPLE